MADTKEIRCSIPIDLLNKIHQSRRDSYSNEIIKALRFWFASLETLQEVSKSKVVTLKDNEELIIKRFPSELTNIRESIE